MPMANLTLSRSGEIYAKDTSSGSSDCSVGRVMDNCDASDPAWATVGGCTLRKGSVSLSEFFNLLFSPHYGTIPVGHPSWRNEPSYITTSPGRAVRATNWGGRDHTFTEVANFGGGFVPVVNGSLSLAPGTHKFQCRIHPWMTAVIKVE